MNSSRSSLEANEVTHTIFTIKRWSFLIFIYVILIPLGTLLFFYVQSTQAEDKKPEAHGVDLSWRQFEECQNVLQRPLLTLDLNGDGKCDDLDVAIFRFLSDDCMKSVQTKPSEIQKIEKLDLDCDGCISKKDQEKFLAHCEKADAFAKQSREQLPPQ